MTKQEIIFDWLEVKENRNKLTTIAVSKEVIDFLLSVANIYEFMDGEVIYEVGDKFYKLKII